MSGATRSFATQSFATQSFATQSWAALAAGLLFGLGLSLSGMLDPARVRDPALRPVAEKVAAGARLTTGDAARLYRSHDLLGVGAMADAANRARHGDVVTSIADSAESIER